MQNSFVGINRKWNFAVDRDGIGEKSRGLLSSQPAYFINRRRLDFSHFWDNRQKPFRVDISRPYRREPRGNYILYLKSRFWLNQTKFVQISRFGSAIGPRVRIVRQSLSFGCRPGVWCANRFAVTSHTLWFVCLFFFNEFRVVRPRYE